MGPNLGGGREGLGTLVEYNVGIYINSPLSTGKIFFLLAWSCYYSTLRQSIEGWDVALLYLCTSGHSQYYMQYLHNLLAKTKEIEVSV